MMELVETKFWDKYWENQEFPSEINKKFSFDRCLAGALNEILKDKKYASILEIGCAPGRWMSFYSEDLELLPSGIEYSPVGVDATVQNLDMLNVKYGDFYTGDFFEIEPQPIYDIVISLGFIEHYDNVIDVVKRQSAWLKPGGMLVLGVPNFNGVYKPIQNILDSEILRKHNTSIMNQEFFVKLQDDIGMKLLQSTYIGSFEPSLPLSMRKRFNPIRWILRKILVVLSRVRNRLKIMDSYNNKYISSYLLSVYQGKKS